MLQKIFILSFLLFAASAATKAQGNYKTLEGHVTVAGEYNGVNFIAESHKLQLTFNRAYNEVSGKISPRTFISGIAVLDTILKTKSPEWLTFKGLVAKDFITWEHSEMDETIPLTLSINGQDVTVQMKATFTHLSGGSTFSCMLSGQFYLDLATFKFENMPEGLKTEINVQLQQIVLRRQ